MSRERTPMIDGPDHAFNDWQNWRKFFAARTASQLPDPFADEPQLAAVPKSLAKSLAIFQLGESGGSTIVQQSRDSHITAIDQAYTEALALLITEEHRHAELLACGVRMLGGELIHDAWMAKVRIFGRRLTGLRGKVIVQLVAQVIGIAYFDLLASKLPSTQLKTLLETIVTNELSHLNFHCCFLRTQTWNAWRRLVFRLSWRILTYAAAVVALLIHRPAISDMNINIRIVWRRWITYARHAEHLVTDSTPAPHSMSSTIQIAHGKS